MEPEAGLVVYTIVSLTLIWICQKLVSYYEYNAEIREQIEHVNISIETVLISFLPMELSLNRVISIWENQHLR